MKNIRLLSPKMVNTGKLWEVIFNTIVILGKTDHGQKTVHDTQTSARVPVTTALKSLTFNH